MSSKIPSGFITIARVLRPQGRKGEVAIELHTDFPGSFAQRRHLYALSAAGDRRPVEVESHWAHKGGLVLKLRGVDSIAAAEGLRECELQVPAGQRLALDPGSQYVSDLVGCRVIDLAGGRGRELGVVAEVQFGAGEAPLLLVKSADNKEFLLPFALDFFQTVDVPGRRLEAVLPAGLLQLDAPLTEEEKQQQRRKK